MIKFLDLQAVNAAYAAEIEEAVLRVTRSGWYLRGAETERFEAAYAQYVGTKYAVACGNGLDALRLIFRAYMEMGLLREGDEVIVPANTYIASILSVTYNGLKPVFVEPDWGTLQIDDALIEQAITPRTRAILLVHLYGRCSYTERVGELCRKYNLLLVEDNAQAHGCAFQFTIDNSQLTIHNAQFTIDNAQCTIDNSQFTIDKVRASERESSLLELLQRAQPKLSEANSQLTITYRIEVIVNVIVGSELRSRCHATPKINFYHLKKPISRV